MKLHTVKLFMNTIVEGTGEGHHAETMLSVRVMAAGQGDAHAIVENAFSRLLQHAVDGDLMTSAAADT
jgi:hypothetical protein